LEETPENWFADFATINAVNLNLGPMYESFKDVGAGGIPPEPEKETGQEEDQLVDDTEALED